MKVGIFLKANYFPSEGGGYSYYDMLIQAIDKIDIPEIDLVFLSNSPSPTHFKKSVIALKSAEGLKTKFLQTVVWVTSSRLLNRIARRAKAELARLDYSNKLGIVRQHSIDIIYYPTQAQLNIPDVPSILTNWDLGHRSSYTFPEFTNNGELVGREHFYNTELRRALAIFTESEAGKKELINYLNINPARIFVVPLFAGKVVELDISEEEQNDCLSTCGLEKGNYFFYPAQFWAHKNHYNLLLAFREFLPQRDNFKLVFTGSDKGNKAYLKELVLQFQLENAVVFLDFVSDEVLFSLYKNASALVMPTLLGPTNMPLLEAQLLNTPVVCSDFDGHRELLGEAALYVDPLKPEKIANAMFEIIDPAVRLKLLQEGRVIASSKNYMENTMTEFTNAIISVKGIRKCWK